MIRNYFINGFLDSGKTTFIKNLIRQKEFNTGESTLLILCEDGEEEYEPELLGSRNIQVAWIEDEEDFNPEHITKIEKKIRPKRVIVEFNGMWNRKNIQVPWYWDKPIEVTLFNAMTFEMYAKNMKSLVSEQVRSAAIAVFNRCDNKMNKLASFRRSIRAVNSSITVSFENADGEINPRFDEDLPYDVSKDKIAISDESFAVFYLDAMENVDRYVGKNVEFTGMVIKKSEDNSGAMIVGRYAMTCCAEDLTLFGFICDYSDNVNIEIDDWVHVKAVVEKDYMEKYDIWFPTFSVVELEKCEEPEKEIVDVY